MYRDAGNFKAFGTVVLDAHVTWADESLIRGRLEGGEFFIAEQVGVPPLYEQLYQSSGGPTKLDHCWHEFIGLHELTTLPNCHPVRASEFIQKFARVEHWDETLSPHFSIGASL